MNNYINVQYLYSKGRDFSAEEIHEMIIDSLFNNNYKKLKERFKVGDTSLSEVTAKMIKHHGTIAADNKRSLFASRKSIVYQEFKDNLKALKQRYKEYRTHVSSKKNVNGPLLEFHEELSKFFSGVNAKNNSITQILLLSGCYEIHVRYKYDDSIIKKLSRKSLNKLEDSSITIDELVHDLIGVRFVCQYPYQREWVARVLYNYFDIPNRDDEHLVYGFFSLKRASGYRALHCDISKFNPKYTSYYPKEDEEFFTINRYNVEIQVQTTMEATWAKMEHEVSYNIHSKGTGRPEEIRVLWQSMASRLETLEKEFETLKFSTELSSSALTRRGFSYYRPMIDKKHQEIILTSEKEISDAENDLLKHEISRAGFLQRAHSNFDRVMAHVDIIKEQDIQDALRLQAAFVYYKFSQYSEFYTLSEIKSAIKKSVEQYDKVASKDTSKQRHKLIVLNASIRYCRLRQKDGYGLMQREVEPVTKLDNAMEYFKNSLKIMLTLDENSEELLLKDGYSYFKIIYYLEVLAQEIEVSHERVETLADMCEAIRMFRKNFYSQKIKKQFFDKLEVLHTGSYHFLLGFINTLLFHKIITPKDALKRIIAYSASGQVRYIDKFYYEVSAYKYHLDSEDRELLVYHKNNALFLLSRIQKQYSIFEYEKARTHYSYLMGNF